MRQTSNETSVQLVCTHNLGKGKVTRNRLESPEGGRVISLHSLDLGARREWVVSITQRPLYPR
jgi:hypothetical protein